MNEMKVMVWKMVDLKDTQEIKKYLTPEWSVQMIEQAGKPAARQKKERASAKQRVYGTKGRRTRKRKMLTVTPELVQQMTKMREEGYSYRIIGGRYGVSDARAWQIVNQEAAKLAKGGASA